MMPFKAPSIAGAVRTALKTKERQPDSLEALGSRKSLTEDEVTRARALMVADAGLTDSKRRPSQALILNSFEADPDCAWMVSVCEGDRVAVLDKRDDGWWLVDKSCGAGHGPFGLVPGQTCMWKVHDDVVPAPVQAGFATKPLPLSEDVPPPPSSQQNGPPRVGSFPPQLPPREKALVSALPPRATPPDAEGTRDQSQPQDPVEEAPLHPVYTAEDLEASKAYMRELIHGQNPAAAAALAPRNFNELCLNAEFAGLIRDYADSLRRLSRS